MPVLSIKADVAPVVAKLGALTTQLRAGAQVVVVADAQRLLQTVQQKLSGDVLQMRSGRLRASMSASVDDLAGSVASDGTVPYARIQEFGGRVNIPDVVPVHARALAFAYGGRMVFAEHTAAHVVEIPKRSYMRASLDEVAPGFLANIRKAVESAAA